MYPSIVILFHFMYNNISPQSHMHLLETKRKFAVSASILIRFMYAQRREKYLQNVVLKLAKTRQRITFYLTMLIFAFTWNTFKIHSIERKREISLLKNERNCYIHIFTSHRPWLYTKVIELVLHWCDSIWHWIDLFL